MCVALQCHLASLPSLCLASTSAIIPLTVGPVPPGRACCRQYERVLTNSVAEWLFVRLRTTLEFEARDVPGVQAYYDQLSRRDGQRAVRATSKDVANLVESDEGFLPTWARKRSN